MKMSDNNIEKLNNNLCFWRPECFYMLQYLLKQVLAIISFSPPKLAQVGVKHVSAGLEQLRER